MSAVKILPAASYNNLLVDHDATSQSHARDLKSNHVEPLIGILRAHELDDDLEIHVLHRHFLLDDGEAMVHREISLEGNDGVAAPGFSIDVAKAVKCPDDSAAYLIPVMWYVAEVGKLVSYEYAVATPSNSHPGRVAGRIPTKKLDAFAKDFSGYVWGAGLQNLISLKDKSCVAGLEYPAPEFRALFKVPASLVALAANSGLIETGWELDREGNDLLPVATDTHVTKTRQTSGGTVAHYHVTVSNSVGGYDLTEISPAYWQKMWVAVESATFGTGCPAAG